MLNPFPELLTFGLLSPFIIRICLGAVFVRHGYFKLFKNRDEAVKNFGIAGEWTKILVIAIGSIELIGGIMLLAGFLTQVAAFSLAALVLAIAIFKKVAGISGRNLGFMAFLFLTLVSLLFSGAGFFAFDVPL
ncbi:MAG: DoxX family protein [Patescibacteria group bacterium]